MRSYVAWHVITYGKKDKANRFKATALVNEAFLRLVGAAGLNWQNRAHFFRVIELRFFGGLSLEETAVVLRISPQSVKRDWKLAKAWFLREMDHSEDPH